MALDIIGTVAVAVGTAAVLVRQGGKISKTEDMTADFIGTVAVSVWTVRFL